MNILRRFRRRTKVEIVCPHGAFIPGAHRLGTSRRYGCRDCGFEVQLSTFRGELTW